MVKRIITSSKELPDNYAALHILNGVDIPYDDFVIQWFIRKVEARVNNIISTRPLRIRNILYDDGNNITMEELMIYVTIVRILLRKKKRLRKVRILDINGAIMLE